MLTKNPTKASQKLILYNSNTNQNTMPNAIKVNTKDVPPILINGNVCPVTGIISTETNILISA